MEISENGINTCVKRLSDKECSIGYSLYVDGRKELYFDIFGNYSTDLSEEYYESAEIFVNGTMYQERYPSSFCSGIIDLGTFENEKVVTCMLCGCGYDISITELDNTIYISK